MASIRINTTSTPLLHSSSTSSSPLPQWKYDVFLSFVEEETGRNFTDHLCEALNRNGFYDFRDHRRLKKGKANEPEIFKAIRESRISVIIFSKTYASSIRCLDELVEIMECKKELGQVVLPVFYNVNPSEVRKQTGSFEEAFSEHEGNFGDNKEKVQRWRNAVTEAGHLSGFHLQDGYESKFIQDIVKEISSKPSPTMSSASTEFVGIDLRMEILRLRMGVGSDDVQFVGIHGMGGIGKTTLARAFYKEMSCHFDGSCFIANVREVSEQGRLVSLQKKLLSQILEDSSIKIWDIDDGMDKISRRLCHKKVLIVIDDVNHIDQLRRLAGNSDWFGLGSRIIITTRDKHLLTVHGVDAVYEAEHLDRYEALRLLSLKAFKNYSPPDNYLELCKSVEKYGGGLPLALEVLGSFLHGRSVDEWIDALERLKEDPDNEISNCLQIGFDGLEETEKNIFLDVAFFFKGMHKDYVMEILDSCGFFPNIGMEVLMEKSLISLSDDNKLLMHDLLEEMGKKTVQRNSPTELGQRSRLWKENEVHDVLMNSKGTEAIEGITHKFQKEKEVYLSAKAFAKMNKLRVLKISNVQLPQGLHYLSNEMRLLEWDGYPLRSLPSGFQPHQIVTLKLRYSRIQFLWKGIEDLNKLKVIDLSFSENLTRVPNLVGVPNLEILILEGCTKLSRVHSSVGFLKKLLTLSLKDCKNLSILPRFVSLESLQICTIAGCSKLNKFPEIVGKMDSLWKLDVSGTAIEYFDSSRLLLMKNVFSGWKGASCKPQNLFSRCCSMLSCLNLSDRKLEEAAIPDAFGQLSSLKVLDLSDNDFVNLPACVNRLSNLVLLSLNNCKRLKSLPELPSDWTTVTAHNCASLETWLRLLFSELGHSNIFGGGTSIDVERKRKFFNVPHFCSLSFSVFYDQKHCQLYHERSPEKEAIHVGCEIPWNYSNRSEASSIRIDWPASHDTIKNQKLKAVAACCVFGFHDRKPPIATRVNMDSDICIYNLGFFVQGAGFGRCIDFTVQKGVAVPDYCWHIAIPQYEAYLNDKSGSDCQFEIHYQAVGPGLEVKKCGIWLVYEPDMEGTEQAINQCNSPRSVLDNSSSVYARNRLILEAINELIYIGLTIGSSHENSDGAGTSGSGSSYT